MIGQTILSIGNLCAAAPKDDHRIRAWANVGRLRTNMNLHSLASFLDGKTSAELISKEIDSEVENYRKGFAKKGSSLPIYVTGDDFNFSLKPEHIQLLCNSYSKGFFNEWHLSYISNALDLSSSFLPVNERVEEAIFKMADPEVNSLLTPEVIKQICETL